MNKTTFVIAAPFVNKVSGITDTKNKFEMSIFVNKSSNIKVVVNCSPSRFELGAEMKATCREGETPERHSLPALV